MTSRIIPFAAAAALLAGTASLALAQGGASDQAPGQRMQDEGKKPDSPGASGYAPGQQMQDQGSQPGSPGASGFAPGQQGTTGAGSAPGTTGKSGADKDDEKK